MARHEGAGHNGAGNANGPSKPELDRLRSRMLDHGYTIEQIALAIMTEWGCRPRKAWRYSHDLTQREVADRYNRLINDPSAPMSSNRISDYENWPHGGIKPKTDALAILARIYGTMPWKLIDFHDLERMNSHERAALKPAPSPIKSDSVYRATTKASGYVEKQNEPLHYRSTAASIVERDIDYASDQVASVARESRDHSEKALGNIMPEATIDEITIEVERLAKEYVYSDPRGVFPDTVRTRDRIYRLLEQGQYPHQTSHLYYLASITCAFLSDISMDIGLRRAAWEQAQASWTYAEIIGHNTLRFLARGTQSALAFWGNRPQRALAVLNSAAQWATEPLAQVGLHNGTGLYSALIGRADESRAAIAAAFDAHASATGTSELYDHIGGFFSYTPPMLLQVSAATYLHLGDLDNAERNAIEAVRLLEEEPAEQRSYGSESWARIELGNIRLARGDVEGTVDVLSPVLSLPPSRRLDWMGLRLKDLSSALRSHGLVASTTGRQLGLEIEQFFEVTAANEFPIVDG